MDKIVTDEWRERERKRFADRVYEPVPWEEKQWWKNCKYYDLHHAHVSTKTMNQVAGLLAYTQDEDKGVNDRQTVMKPRRYLHKYLKQVIKDYIFRNRYSFELYWTQRNEENALLPRPSKPEDVNLDDEVEVWASKFEFVAKPTEYFCAATREEIKWVYLNCGDGASSCMSHPTRDYSTNGVHPSEAYAAGDIVICYLKTEGGTVTARAVTFYEKKLYGRIYGKHGNESKLKQALEEDGFVKGSMVGARMLQIPCDYEGEENYVFPYLDNECGVNFHKDGFFCIANYGDYEAQSEYGLLIRGHDWWCVSCDEGGRGDMYYNTHCGDTICDGCYQEYYFTCHECDEVHNWDNDHHELKGDYYCHDCFVENTTECIPCGERVDDDDIAGTNEDGNSVCDDCKENDGLVEDEDGVLVDPNKEPEPEEA